MDYKFEICIDSIESAIASQLAGADRVELCDNLYEGGTTPSYGTISSAKNNITIGLNVIIRPRGGDFIYTNYEYDIMRKDIDICKKCGVNGIVTGILRSNGDIDIERTARLIEYAYPMPVTFHRAFDMCADPLKGLEDIIETGASRLLTSGQKNKASDGAELIRKLVDQANHRIIIMPGSGIDESNISWIANITGAKEFHLSGRKVINSNMTFRKEGISMGSAGTPEFSRKVADSETIKTIIKNLRLT